MKRLFADIAEKYDMMNRIMSLSLDKYWRRRSLDLLPQRDFRTVLDLACGTGDFSAELLKRFPGIRICGADITPEMIAIAEKKLAGEKNVQFFTADAQNLECFGAESFDLVVCAFGFRNFPDKSRALAECHRVLKPSGILIVLELFRPEYRFAGMLVNFWLAAVAKLFCRRESAEYAYLRKSISGTVSADEFADAAARAGFAEIGRRRLFPSATSIAFAAKGSAVV